LARALSRVPEAIDNFLANNRRPATLFLAKIIDCDAGLLHFYFQIIVPNAVPIVIILVVGLVAFVWMHFLTGILQKYEKFKRYFNKFFFRNY
jgi:hypothetical protein